MFSPKSVLPAALAAVCLVAAPAAIAQQDAHGSRGSQAPATASSPGQKSTAPPVASPFSYQSAVEDYRRYGDEPLTPWAEANDTVATIGGWQAYAREAQAEPGPSPAVVGESSAPPPDAAPTGGHGGHSGHKQP